MSVAREFASDNTAPADPAVLEAMAAANHGPAHAYGADPWTARATAWFRDEFGGDTTVFPVWNGTGANVVALRALTRPYHAVLCTAHSHIQVDECGAPELFTGCKLVDLPSPDARIKPAQLRGAVRGLGNEHAVQPHVLSLTQTTEYGTAYSVAQLTELCGVAHELGLRVHMDGARIANAAASLGVPMRAFTRDAGVDVLSFGATKNGAINAEAVLVFDPALAAELPFLRKQSAQLASKMRFQSAQFLALADGERWLANARHANAMAQRLEAGLRGIDGVTITQSVEANAVFALLPAAVTAALQERFHFYVWNEVSGEVRLMASWATQPEDVDELIAAVGAAMRVNGER